MIQMQVIRFFANKGKYLKLKEEEFKLGLFKRFEQLRRNDCSFSRRKDSIIEVHKT